MKVLFKVLIIHFFFIHQLKAQLNFNIDSLLNVYETQKLDSNKVITNNKIINYYMYRNPKLARKYALEQFDISNKIEFSGGKSMSNYQLGILYNNINNIDSAKYHYELALKHALVYNNSIFVSQAYHGLALLEFNQGNLNEADVINDKNLEFNMKNKDSVGVAYSLDFKGRINENRGYYLIALENVLKSLKLLPIVSTPINKDVRIADAKNHLANIEFNLSHFDNAIKYNEEALEIYINQEDLQYQAIALHDLGKAYKKKGDYGKSKALFNQSLEKSRLANSASTITSNLSEIGSINNIEKRPNEGVKLLQESVKIASEIKSERLMALSKIELSESYNQLNLPEKALSELNDVINYAKNSNSKLILRDAYQKRSFAYQIMNLFEKSLIDHKKFKNLNDSIFNEKNLQKIEELRIIYETEKKEAALALQKEEIKSLNQKVEISNLKKGLYAGGMFSFIAISGLVFFGYRQRIKKNKIEREKQETIYEQEIEHKKKELASQTLHLVQKNTFIQELQENLERLKNNPELFKMEFKRIVMLLKKENASDKDWEVFKSYFVEVNNDFDKKLQSIYPEISEKETRLAALLKMNLSTKEIATMLNVLPDSILKSKYRLKKKLELDKDTDLYQYLSTL